ncbi:MAG: phage holin family protein [Actinobacteria bacterium]|nr:MAG: phage holin family protein [Actinomycetota bacterium]
MRFLLRWLVMSIAVAAAVLLVPGIQVYGTNAWIVVLVLALITGLLNATLGLILKIGTFGCIIMTLGLFNLVINAGMLYLASYITSQWLNLGVVVQGFWPAFWGGVVISIVSGVLNWFLPEQREE